MSFDLFEKSKEKPDLIQGAKTDTKNEISDTQASSTPNTNIPTKTSSEDTKTNTKDTPRKRLRLTEAIVWCMDPKTKEASLKDIKDFLSKKGIQFIDEAEFLKFLEKRRMQYYVKDGFIGFVDFALHTKAHKKVLAKKNAAQNSNQQDQKTKATQKEQENSIKRCSFMKLNKFPSYYDPKIIKELSEQAQKEFWGQNNRILADYLRYYFNVIKNDKDYVFESDEGSEYICFNTGLLTKSCEDIYGVFKKNDPFHTEKLNLEYNFFCFAEASEKIIRENFKNLPPYYQFLKTKEDVVFDTKLKITERLDHILEDNLDRFPDFFKNMNKQLQYVAYKGAKDMTIKMLERNYRIALPQLYEGKLGFFIPLYLSENLENPDVALAVTKEKEGYHITTVLTLEQAYINARVVSKVESSWLKLAEN